MQRLAFCSLVLVCSVPLCADVYAEQDGASAQNTRRCIVQGHVTSQGTGEPLSGATLRLEAPSANLDHLSQSSYELFGIEPTPQTDTDTETSSSDGGFCFSSTKSGTYVLTASKPNFLNTTYGASTFSRTGKGLILSESPLAEIALSLAPLSGITGRVTNDNGNAVEDANVAAVRKTWIQGREAFIPVQGVQSDSHGKYHIGKLTPGMYYVYAQPVPDLKKLSELSSPAPGTSIDNSKPKVVRTYYPRALSLTEAQAVSVPVGNDLAEIDIRARSSPTFHVKGRVLGEKEEWQTGAVQLLPGDQDPIMLVMSGDSNIGPDGSFDFDDVAPGTYDLSFRSNLATAHFRLSVRETDVSVDLPIVNNGALRGKLVLEGGPKSAGLNSSITSATLTQADSLIASSYPVTVNSAGELVADNIPAAKYFLKIISNGELYVKLISAGSADTSSGELDMSSGGTTNVSVLLRSGLAGVSGTVERSGTSTNSNVPSGNVVLIPSPYKLDGSGIYFSAVDQASHFKTGLVKPGTYRALAVESIDAQTLQNPFTLQRLEKLGTEVDVKENQNSVLTLRLVSADELD